MTFTNVQEAKSSSWSVCNLNSANNVDKQKKTEVIKLSQNNLPLLQC